MRGYSAIVGVFRQKCGFLPDRVRELAPETFSNDDSLEEIDLYAIVAEELGIEIDPEIVEEARQELGTALDRQVDMEMERMRGDGGRAGWASELGEMDVLFSRLVE